MRVHIVTYHCDGGMDIFNVFSTKEMAREYIDKMLRKNNILKIENFDIEDYIVDVEENISRRYL